MKLKIENLRNKIEIIDKKIFNLIHKRLLIVKKIGLFKIKNNISFYVPEREKDLININIKNNKNNDISNRFIKNLLNKLIYESHLIEFEYSTSKYKNIKNNKIKVVFIGGSGNMGKLFKKIFILYNYEVLEINSKDWYNCENILRKSNIIIICSPISKINEILNNIKFYLSEECILLDISSIKYSPINKMLSIHKGPVLGLHPMFGPNIINLTKQTIIYCNGRYPEKYKWLLDQFKLWGVILYKIDSKYHDKYMSYIQSLRYFNYLTIGSFLMKEKINLNNLIKLSPCIYNIHLSNLSKFFSGDIKLYLEIIFSSKNNLIIFKRYLNNIINILSYFKLKDKNKITDIFDKTKLWINPNLDKLLEINNLLYEEVLSNK